MPSAAYIVRVAQGARAVACGMRAVAGGIGAHARGRGAVALSAVNVREDRVHVLSI
jgi:hypothetical protein